MHGIDCLTPPPVGDCPFEYAFKAMPDDFFCIGRFNSTLWYNRSREEILANLASILPHQIYQEHAFYLAVTEDGLKNVNLDTVRLVRDCIQEYEKEGARNH